MNRSRAVLILSVMLASAFAQEPPPNLVGNPSLEGPVNADGLPDGWARFADPPEGYRSRVVNEGRTGTHSLLIEGAGQYGGVVTNRTLVNRARGYAARGWVRIEGEASATATVKLDYYAEDGKFLGSSYAGMVTPGLKGWNLVAVAGRCFEFPQAKTIAPVVALTGPGKAWFDDLELIVRERPASVNHLIVNGSMENVAGPAPSTWYIGTSEGGSVQSQWSAENPKDGWYCLRVKGNAEWMVAVSEQVKINRELIYTLKGYARADRGRVQIKFDYFRDGQYLGQTATPDTSGADWQELTVVAEPGKFPEATHLAVAGVGLGEMDVYFDAFVLTARTK